MNEQKCEKCEHEKECLNMVCFYKLLEKEEGKIRADERAKVLDEFTNWYRSKGYSAYDIGLLIREYKKEQKNGNEIR